MAEFSTLAAIDLGSNSFHCQIVRVVGDQIYPLDSLREPVRLGAGLDEEKQLDPAVQERALACLQRFGERVRGFDRHAVRAVGTNTLRVAKNAKAFLKLARAALGFPIEVSAAREEVQPLVAGFSRKQWQQAVGSSGTIRALAELLQANGYTDGEITAAAIDKLRAAAIKAGSFERFEGIRPDRVPVLPGGLAILSAVLSELDIEEMTPATGAMREG